ncbi:MAG: transglutaminase family protein [Pseudomonadota bacterium]
MNAVAPDPATLDPTSIIDSDHPRIVAFARHKAGDIRDTVDKAVALYLAVRDGIWYDPYVPFHLPEHYRASRVLSQERGYCVSKASLLCALGRAAAIPTRLGFATVRNHLATRELIEMMGTNTFVYHGYVEFHLEGRWVKATPAFNRELCERHGVEPLEFDGRGDSLFQAYNRENQRFMEYVVDHGTRPDVPVDEILAAWEAEYGRDRVRAWIHRNKGTDGATARDFDREEIWKG